MIWWLVFCGLLSGWLVLCLYVLKLYIRFFFQNCKIERKGWRWTMPFKCKNFVTEVDYPIIEQYFPVCNSFSLIVAISWLTFLKLQWIKYKMHKKDKSFLSYNFRLHFFRTFLRPWFTKVPERREKISKGKRELSASWNTNAIFLAHPSSNWNDNNQFIPNARS